MRKTMPICLAACGLVFLGLSAGCKKSAPAEKVEAPRQPSATNSAKPISAEPVQPSQTFARVHWLGIKRIARDTNSAHFMELWNLPQSGELKNRTLDKLALALVKGSSQQSQTSTNPILQSPTAELLRPLFNDLVDEESYLEAYQPGNRPGQLAFAIRLGNQRAMFWQTNLGEALATLSGNRPTPGGVSGGWKLELKVEPSKSQVTENSKLWVELARAGDWAILSLTMGDSNRLVANFRAKIERDHTPVGDVSASSYEVDPVTRTVRSVTSNTSEAPYLWLDCYADLTGISRSLGLGWKLPDNMPTISIAVNGDGTNVRSSAELEFPRPLPIELEPWNIPTNLIYEPLIGFSAIRGFRPWLKSFKPWNDLALGTPPNQAFFWAQPGMPALHFFAMPSVQASNQVSKLAEFATNRVNLLLEPYRLGKFVVQNDSPRVFWRGMPWIFPALDSVDSGAGPFIKGGFWIKGLTSRPAPPSLSTQVSSTTNLVWYDWEQTGQCMGGLMDTFQSVRHVFGFPRLPLDSTMPWLGAMRPGLGVSQTVMTFVPPNRLSFNRNSGVGLNGFELHVLSDWLESPDFPHGLYTFRAPKPPLRVGNSDSDPGQAQPPTQP